MEHPIPDHYYWVKLKPFKPQMAVKGKIVDVPDAEPIPQDWEPMQYTRRGWCRCGVIYRFGSNEVLEVGPEIVYQTPDHATKETESGS